MPGDHPCIPGQIFPREEARESRRLEGIQPQGSWCLPHRCLVEGAGDVAFVRHSTVLENTDGEWQMPGFSTI